MIISKTRREGPDSDGTDFPVTSKCPLHAEGKNAGHWEEEREYP